MPDAGVSTCLAAPRRTPCPDAQPALQVPEITAVPVAVTVPKLGLKDVVLPPAPAVELPKAVVEVPALALPQLVPVPAPAVEEAVDKALNQRAPCALPARSVHACMPVRPATACHQPCPSALCAPACLPGRARRHLQSCAPLPGVAGRSQAPPTHHADRASA